MKYDFYEGNLLTLLLKMIEHIQTSNGNKVLFISYKRPEIITRKGKRDYYTVQMWLGKCKVNRLGKWSCLFILTTMCTSALYIMPILLNFTLEFHGES